MATMSNLTEIEFNAAKASGETFTAVSDRDRRAEFLMDDDQSAYVMVTIPEGHKPGHGSWGQHTRTYRREGEA